jgi:hypothetical protein
VAGKAIDYTVFEGLTEPEGDFGNVGDIYHIGKQKLYYKSDDGWMEGKDSETEHPEHGKELKISFSRNRGSWIKSGTFRTRKAKEVASGSRSDVTAQSSVPTVVPSGSNTDSILGSNYQETESGHSANAEAAAGCECIHHLFLYRTQSNSR